MNRRERLLATLQGKPIDRPAVSFYEINGLDEHCDDLDPFNIYSHPSWHPLIELAREKTDRIVMRGVSFKDKTNSLQEFTTQETWITNGSRYERTTIQAGNRTLTSLTRRDPNVNTLWQVEHLLKDLGDLKAWLELPHENDIGIPDPSEVIRTEAILEDSGIVMIDTADPLCQAAALFDLGTFTVLASTETGWFHKLLDVFALELQAKTEAIAQCLPGRLWRVYGPEYASPPYLPPRLFREYVVNYDRPLVAAIQKTGGYARLHCHGKLKLILDDIVATGCDSLDPIEPPPQGDVTLAYVCQNYGKQMVLFGNLEASDLENLPTAQFEQKILTALHEGTTGEGRGFVLLPSSCPYGRELSPLALVNYQKMVECVERF
jgi:hypothetical protein